MQVHSRMRGSDNDERVYPNDTIDLDDLRRRQTDADIYGRRIASSSNLPVEIRLPAIVRGDSSTTVSMLRSDDDEDDNDEEFADGVGWRVALALEESDEVSGGEEDSDEVSGGEEDSDEISGGEEDSDEDSGDEKNAEDGDNHTPDKNTIRYLRQEMSAILDKLTELESQAKYRKETFQTVREKLSEWERSRSCANKARNDSSWRRFPFMRRKSNDSSSDSAKITALDEETFALMVASKQCSAMDVDIHAMHRKMNELLKQTSLSAINQASEDDPEINLDGDLTKSNATSKEAQDISEDEDVEESNQDAVQTLRAMNRCLREDVNTLQVKLSDLEAQAGDYRKEVISMREKVTLYERSFAPYRDLEDLREKLTEYEGALAHYKRRLRSFFSAFKNLHGLIGDGYRLSLDEDTFSLMMISKPCSQSWIIGLTAFLFQMALGIMMASNSSKFAIPFRVDNTVLVAQFLTTMLCLSTQSDVLTSIEICVVLWITGSNWDKVIGEEGNRSCLLWLTRVLFPNLLKFTQGSLVIYLCYIIIIRSDNIMDLLKDFTALMVLSEVDNIFFRAADHGYLGRFLQGKTAETRAAQIESLDSSFVSTNNDARTLLPELSTSTIDPTEDNSRGNVPTHIIITETKDRSFHVRLLLLFLIIITFIGFLGSHVFKQRSGAYFEKEYPGCRGHFGLADKNFGDGKCYGGVLNTQECGFEGGDCMRFNTAFPRCKGENLTSVEERIGNGVCDEELSIPDCDYDGGDCCPHHITQSPLFQDGQCNGGVYNTKHCGFDGGDCISFNRDYPDCPLYDLSIIGGGSSAVLGNKVCDTGIYSLKSCGWKNGDCDNGQIGQDLIFSIDGRLITDAGIETHVTKLSLDGNKVAVGLCMSDKNGDIDVSHPGLVKVYEYNETIRKWIQLGGDILGVASRDKFGCSLAMNSNGKRIAIGAPFHDGRNKQNAGRVKVFDYDEENNDWKQIGQDIQGEHATEKFGYNIDMTANGLRLAISSPYKNVNSGQIRVYDLDVNGNNPRWIEISNNTIQGGDPYDYLSWREFQMSSADGSRIITSSKINQRLSRQIYEYSDESGNWTKSDAIPSPNSRSSAISSDGNRIAIGSPGVVEVYDFDLENRKWEQVDEIKDSLKEGDTNGFGHSIAMSADGNVLAIGSIEKNCIAEESFCATGSVQFFIFDKLYDKNTTDNIPGKGKFHEAISLAKGSSFQDLNPNFIQERKRNRDHSVFGHYLSMSADASVLSIGGFNIQEDYTFVKVYALNELFDTKCAVPFPDNLGDGTCDSDITKSYNTSACGFDGGDCL